MIVGTNRRGKSWVQATMAAEVLKRGGRVGLARINEHGVAIVEEVVAVPGFDDGRQLTQTKTAPG